MWARLRKFLRDANSASSESPAQPLLAHAKQNGTLVVPVSQLIRYQGLFSDPVETECPLAGGVQAYFNAEYWLYGGAASKVSLLPHKLQGREESALTMKTKGRIVDGTLSIHSLLLHTS